MKTVWTAALAREALIREMTDGKSVYSPRPGPIITAIHDDHAEISVFNAVQRVGLSDADGGRQRQTMMFVWASKMAQYQRSSQADASIAEVCRAHGWGKGTFNNYIRTGFNEVARIIQDRLGGAQEALDTCSASARINQPS